MIKILKIHCNILRLDYLLDIVLDAFLVVHLNQDNQNLNLVAT